MRGRVGAATGGAGSRRRSAGGSLAGPVGGDVRAGGAALGAEPAAAVRRGVQVDVAAALVGADPEPGAAELAQPHREAPDRAGHVLGRRPTSRGRSRACASRGVVAGDPRLHRVRLQQGVERVDRLDVAAGGAVLEHLTQPLGPRRRVATSRSVASAACQLSAPKNARTCVQRLHLGVHEIDRGPGVLVEVHGSKVVGRSLPARGRVDSRAIGQGARLARRARDRRPPSAGLSSALCSDR